MIRAYRGVLVALSAAGACALGVFACGSFDDAAGGGAAAADGGGDGGAEGGNVPKVVFVAAVGLQGDTVGQADAMCDALIKREHPGRQAIAWAFVNDLVPFDRMGPGADGPWHSPSGRLVFADRAALASGTLSSPLTEGFDGGSFVGLKAWTGLAPDGGPSGLDCRKWRSKETTDEGSVGVLGATTGAWASGGAEACASTNVLLCLEI